MSFIPYGRQSISEADIQQVVQVLRSDWLTQGPMIERFEAAVAEYCGVRHAVAVSSATAGLHLACLALGLQPGDRVWTSPNTFVASANCARYCGADVDFVDIDPRTYNMSVPALREKLVQAAQAGTLPTVVVPVHFAGQSCSMADIAALSQEYGFRVLEDAAHAIGGRYQDRPVGSCDFSDMAVFSLHPVKIITTGEGGLVLTNRDDWHADLLRLRSHGITREADAMTEPSHGAWYYQQVDLGLNYRMTDMQAALGLSQMDRLDAFVRQRHVLAERYDALLSDYPVVRPYRDPQADSAFHLYVVQIPAEAPDGPPEVAGARRRAVFDALRAQQIGVQVHYIPVHTQPYYRRQGFRPGDFPQAEQYYAQALSLPLYPDLTFQEQDRVVACLGEALRAIA